MSVTFQAYTTVNGVKVPYNTEEEYQALSRQQKIYEMNSEVISSDNASFGPFVTPESSSVFQETEFEPDNKIAFGTTSIVSRSSKTSRTISNTGFVYKGDGNKATINGNRILTTADLGSLNGGGGASSSSSSSSSSTTTTTTTTTTITDDKKPTAEPTKPTLTKTFYDNCRNTYANTVISTISAQLNADNYLRFSDDYLKSIPVYIVERIKSKFYSVTENFDIMDYYKPTHNSETTFGEIKTETFKEYINYYYDDTTKSTIIPFPSNDGGILKITRPSLEISTSLDSWLDDVYNNHPADNYTSIYNITSVGDCFPGGRYQINLPTPTKKLVVDVANLLIARKQDGYALYIKNYTFDKEDFKSYYNNILTTNARGNTVVLSQHSDEICRSIWNSFGEKTITNKTPVNDLPEFHFNSVGVKVKEEDYDPTQFYNFIVTYNVSYFGVAFGDASWFLTYYKIVRRYGNDRFDLIDAEGGKKSCWTQLVFDETDLKDIWKDNCKNIISEAENHHYYTYVDNKRKEAINNYKNQFLAIYESNKTTFEPSFQNCFDLALPTYNLDYFNINYSPEIMSDGSIDKNQLKIDISLVPSIGSFNPFTETGNTPVELFAFFNGDVVSKFSSGLQKIVDSSDNPTNQRYIVLLGGYVAGILGRYIYIFDRHKTQKTKKITQNTYLKLKALIDKKETFTRFPKSSPLQIHSATEIFFYATYPDFVWKLVVSNNPPDLEFNVIRSMIEFQRDYAPAMDNTIYFNVLGFFNNQPSFNDYQTKNAYYVVSRAAKNEFELVSKTDITNRNITPTNSAAKYNFCIEAANPQLIVQYKDLANINAITSVVNENKNKALYYYSGSNLLKIITDNRTITEMVYDELIIFHSVLSTRSNEILTTPLEDIIYKYNLDRTIKFDTALGNDREISRKEAAYLFSEYNTKYSNTRCEILYGEDRISNLFEAYKLSENVQTVPYNHTANEFAKEILKHKTDSYYGTYYGVSGLKLLDDKFEVNGVAQFANIPLILKVTIAERYNIYAKIVSVSGSVLSTERIKPYTDIIDFIYRLELEGTISNFLTETYKISDLFNANGTKKTVNFNTLQKYVKIIRDVDMTINEFKSFWTNHVYFCPVNMITNYFEKSSNLDNFLNGYQFELYASNNNLGYKVNLTDTQNVVPDEIRYRSTYYRTTGTAIQLADAYRLIKTA